VANDSIVREDASELCAGETEGGTAVGGVQNEVGVYLFTGCGGCLRSDVPCGQKARVSERVGEVLICPLPTHPLLARPPLFFLFLSPPTPTPPPFLLACSDSLALLPPSFPLSALRAILYFMVLKPFLGDFYKEGDNSDSSYYRLEGGVAGGFLYR